MPKQKTNRSAAKRFKKTGTGKLKHKSQNARHILTKKSSKRKRQLRGTTTLAHADERRIKRLLHND